MVFHRLLAQSHKSHFNEQVIIMVLICDLLTSIMYCRQKILSSPIFRIDDKNSLHHTVINILLNNQLIQY